MSGRHRLAARIAATLVAILATGYLVPIRVTSPIALHSIEEINPQSFWYYPWGKSGTHKGIDIFCQAGTVVAAPVTGFIFRSGYGVIAGNYLYIVGAGWRTYYFAHLDTVLSKKYRFVARGDTIGRVGTTGNAAGKPPHLHYSIRLLLPYLWNFNSSHVEAWSRTFYLDPTKQLGFGTMSFQRRMEP